MNIDEKIKKYILLIEDRNLNDKFTIEEQDPIYDLEEEILTAYGLPMASEISEELQNEVVDENNKHKSLIYVKKYLQKTANNYLNSPAKTDKEILEDGKANKKPFDNVFHYMGIFPHSYCVYLYEELYCRNKITTEEMIRCVNIFRVNEKHFNKLILGNYKEQKINFKVYRMLVALGIPYIDEFMQFEHNINSRDEADNISWSNTYNEETDLSDAINIHHFYIKSIFFDAFINIYMLDILFKAQDFQWHALLLGIEHDFLETLFDYSRFEFEAALLRSNINSGKIALNLREYDMKQLEIIGINLELENISRKNVPCRDFKLINFSKTNNISPINKINFSVKKSNDDLPF